MRPFLVALPILPVRLSIRLSVSYMEGSPENAGPDNGGPNCVAALLNKL